MGEEEEEEEEEELEEKDERGKCLKRFPRSVTC